MRGWKQLSVFRYKGSKVLTMDFDFTDSASGRHRHAFQYTRTKKIAAKRRQELEEGASGNLVALRLPQRQLFFRKTHKSHRARVSSFFVEGLNRRLKLLVQAFTELHQVRRQGAHVNG